MIDKKIIFDRLKILVDVAKLIIGALKTLKAAWGLVAILSAYTGYQAYNNATVPVEPPLEAIITPVEPIIVSTPSPTIVSFKMTENDWKTIDEKIKIECTKSTASHERSHHWEP